MGNGKEFKRNVGQRYSDKPLTSQPFKKELKEFKPWGPACLVCNDTIDTREGASVPTGMRGAKRSQRQGYVHDRCMEPSEDGKLPTHVHSNLLSSLNEGQIRLPNGKYFDTVQGRNVAMEVPVYSEDDMFAAIEAGEALPS